MEKNAPCNHSFVFILASEHLYVERRTECGGIRGVLRVFCVILFGKWISAIHMRIIG